MERPATSPHSTQTVESEVLFLCAEAFVQIRRLSRIAEQAREPRGLLARFSKAARKASATRASATKLIYVLSDAAHNLPELVRLGLQQKRAVYFAGQADRLAQALIDARRLKG